MMLPRFHGDLIERMQQQIVSSTGSDQNLRLSPEFCRNFTSGMSAR